MARFKTVISVVMLSGLAGCAAPEVKGLCPGYVHYSQDDDQSLLAELQIADQNGQTLPVTHLYLRDYGKQRAALKVICKGD
ncbi:hypothetical protein GS501_02475 [Saccharibacter sp. 17.LH.SD]|uniref:hypothetical protein n=1 Tax=Saccharibacter sp. 17.LH.SD TaxID=2689393 RepID=UPI00136ACE19|nr:hypothetical protein [Saccharibacter sp. 17.LH.SD]MXV43918.1 hypothetical protein [Saccharibacter sp. 17.LH.SD]